MRRGQRSPNSGICTARFTAPLPKQQRAPMPASSRPPHLVVLAATPSYSDLVILAAKLPCRHLGCHNAAETSSRPHSDCAVLEVKAAQQRHCPAPSSVSTAGDERPQTIGHRFPTRPPPSPTPHRHLPPTAHLRGDDTAACIRRRRCHGTSLRRYTARDTARDMP